MQDVYIYQQTKKVILGSWLQLLKKANRRAFPTDLDCSGIILILRVPKPREGEKWNQAQHSRINVVDKNN